MNLALFFSLVALLCYATLVGLVIRRGLRIRVHQLFAFYLGTMLVWQLTYIMVSLSDTASAALVWYRSVSAVITGQFIVFFFFARALVRVRERRRAGFLGFLVWAATVFLLLTDRGYFIANIHRHPATGLFVPDFGPLVIPLVFATYTFLGLGITALVRGYQHASSGMERNRFRYLLLSVVISLMGTMANLIPSLVGYPIDVVANIISALLLSYAILRYQLLDISLVVRRGLAYSALTVTIAVVYVLSILLFERLFRGILGVGAFVVPLVLAMLAAMLVQPWREKAELWVDRLLFREKYDSRRMLQELSRRTAAIIDLEMLGSMLLSEICGTMRLERAALFLREENSREFYIAAQQGLDAKTAEMRLGRDHPVAQWLQHSEQVLHASELDLLPQFRSLWSEEKEGLERLNAQLFIPLQVKDDLVGILTTGARESGGGYSADEEVTLSTLANQTAVAVENARLFAVTRARVAELTALQDTGVRLVSSRTLPAVLQVVVESGVRLLGADEAYVALYDAASDRFGASRRSATHGEETPPWTSAAAIPLQMAVRYGKPIIINDLWLQATIPPSLARESRVRAIAACPLRRGEAVIGVLAVAHAQPHSFIDEELRLLRMLSDQATLAIDNAQLLESEQAKRQLADTLREVSGVIGSTLEIDVVLELVLEQLQKVVDYDSATIMLLSGNRLEVNNVRGFSDRAGVIGQVLPLSQYVLFDELIHERRPTMSIDIRQDGRWVDLPKGLLEVHAFIGVPLVVRDQARGILAMGKAEPSHYSRDDLQNVVAFANQAAIAIENARLYHETISEKHKTETILKETFSGIVVTDVELRIVTFNTGAETITGQRVEEVIGKRLPEVLGPDIAAPDSPLGRVVATGQRVPPQETVIQTALGLRDILQGTVALYDANRNLFGYLLSFADITRLKEVDRLKTDIVANVSHELRTPLASIKAYTELLLDNIEGEDRQLRDEFLRIIDRETDRLAELISDLLDLSRLEAGRFEVRKTKLEVGLLLADVLSVLDVQRRSRGLAIRADVPDDLPELVADREMVTIILKNLVGNAIKFSRPQGEVQVVLRRTREHLVLQVIDRGIGIPEEAIPHLFQKFYRVATSTESGIEGTGLGLVLTKQAVEAHGGTIEVESQVGVGTTFTVYLPWQ